MRQTLTDCSQVLNEMKIPHPNIEMVVATGFFNHMKGPNANRREKNIPAKVLKEVN